MEWPLQKDCSAFYGNPQGAHGGASAKWEIENLTTIVPPFQMTFAGKKVGSLRIHKKCAPSLLKVLGKIWEAAGHDQKKIDDWGVSIFGGSYNFRLMRGLNNLSMHSYGCALDLDPVRNGLHDTTPHFTADSAVVRAFKSEGWTWGGDWDGDGSSLDEHRCDGMHFQAARIK